MSVWRAIAEGVPVDGALLERAPELAALAGVPQTAEHHGEGDVATHTAMVAAVANRLLEADGGLADAWGGTGAAVLRLAAVLHDVGKPACTTDAGAGRFPAKGHELESARIVARLEASDPWWRSQPLAVRWAVHTAVRNHMWSYAARAGRLSAGAALRSSHLVDPRLLAALWQADTEGRICDDAADLVEARQLAWLVLEEHGAHLPAAHPWLEELGVAVGELEARVRQETLRAAVLGAVDGPGAMYAMIEDRSRAGRGTTLTYTIGLPGSGKSTWAASEAERTGAVVLAADGRRRRDRKAAHAKVREAVPELLHEGRDVIIDATHVDRSSRERWIGHAHTYGATVRAVWVDTSLDQCLARQRTRPPRQAVPGAVIESMAANRRMPSPDEYAQLVVVDEAGREQVVAGHRDWLAVGGSA